MTAVEEDDFFGELVEKGVYGIDEGIVGQRAGALLVEDECVAGFEGTAEAGDECGVGFR